MKHCRKVLTLRMNYSENNKIYGRKIIRSGKWHKKRWTLSQWIAFGIGILIGCLIIAGVTWLTKDNSAEASEVPVPVVTEMTYEVEDDFIPLDVPMDEELQEFVYYSCKVNNLDFPFVMALIATESNFDTDVISGTNDFGLMQINKINHEWLKETLGVTDILDPHQNIMSGIYILSNLNKKYDDPSKVLMAYNMGEGGASRLWNQGIFESQYSIKIKNKSAEYEQQIQERMCEND